MKYLFALISTLMISSGSFLAGLLVAKGLELSLYNDFWLLASAMLAAGVAAGTLSLIWDKTN